MLRLAAMSAAIAFRFHSRGRAAAPGVALPATGPGRPSRCGRRLDSAPVLL